MNNTNGWEINQIFTEIRFTPSPTYFDKKQELLQSFITSYPVYNISNIDLLSMHTNENPGKDLKVMPNRFTLTYEVYKNDDNFPVMAKSNWETVKKRLGINFIERFGMRAFYVRKMDEISANEYVNKFVNNSLLNFGSKITNSSLTLDFKEMSRIIKLNISAGKFQTIAIGNTDNISDSYYGVMFDIDFFEEGIGSKEVNQLFELAMSRFNHYLTRLG